MTPDQIWHRHDKGGGIVSYSVDYSDLAANGFLTGQDTVTMPDGTRKTLDGDFKKYVDDGDVTEWLLQQGNNSFHIWND